MRVSVIATVYNESQSIIRLLDSLANQTRRPDEVIICDAGSQDDTVPTVIRYAEENAEALPGLRVLIEPGANISRGRNLAIDAASGSVIAATDSGVRLDRDWLERLLAPWEAAAMSGSRDVAAVAGAFLPDADGVFQTAMAATVLPMPEDIDPASFLPSSRSVAFTKEIWRAAGGYPEWLDYCEDLVFDYQINSLIPNRKSGFEWAPDARVYFRPREDLLAFWRQYYLYARGDGKADLWRKRHAIRYFTYLVALPVLLAIGCRGDKTRYLGWMGLVAGGVAYCWRPWQRLRSVGASQSFHRQLAASALVPVIRLVGDVAKMCGYPVGLWWRWQNRNNSHIRWRGRLGAHRADSD